jgi:hypothetical protein
MSDFCNLKNRYCNYGTYTACNAKSCPKGYRSKGDIHP